MAKHCGGEPLKTGNGGAHDEGDLDEGGPGDAGHGVEPVGQAQEAGHWPPPT